MRTPNNTTNTSTDNININNINNINKTSTRQEDVDGEDGGDGGDDDDDDEDGDDELKSDDDAMSLMSFAQDNVVATVGGGTVIGSFPFHASSPATPAVNTNNNTNNNNTNNNGGNSSGNRGNGREVVDPSPFDTGRLALDSFLPPTRPFTVLSIDRALKVNVVS